MEPTTEAGRGLLGANVGWARMRGWNFTLADMTARIVAIEREAAAGTPDVSALREALRLIHQWHGGTGNPADSVCVCGRAIAEALAALPDAPARQSGDDALRAAYAERDALADDDAAMSARVAELEAALRSLFDATSLIPFPFPNTYGGALSGARGIAAERLAAAQPARPESTDETAP